MAAARPAESVTSTQPSQLPLAAGQVGTLAQVPWTEVGPGWAIAEYTTGSYQVAAPITLFIIDPAGGVYQIHQWPATTDPWNLIDWSADKTRVLFEDPQTSPPTLHQLTLATGQVTTFTIPASVQVLGYTRPSGENILAAQAGSIVRYSLSGILQARLDQASQSYDASAVSSADGMTEVVSGGSGVELVSNAGGVLRLLPVPGTDSRLGCAPVRWWNSTDVLVRCIPSQAAAPELWLVPVSGAAPTALTPVRADGGPDLGDLDAWQFPTGMYVEALGGCGTVFVGEQSADGSVSVVTVPGSSDNNVIVGTSSSQMLVREFGGCEPGSTLVWFNPATGGVQDVLTQPSKGAGVVSVIAFNGAAEHAG